MKQFVSCGNGPLQKTLASRRAGTSSLEVIMAFTLLGSVLAFSTPLVVRHKRLIASQRDYRLALDEVSNQLQRLSAVSPQNLATVIESLQPSDFISTRLSGARVHGELQTSDMGQRVQVSISWGDEQRLAAPVTLAAWFLPEAASAGIGTDRRTSP